MKKKSLGCSMAKRLTKALREKRRWLGIKVDASCQDRADVEALLGAITESLEPKPNIRLMDWWSSDQRSLLGEATALTANHAEVGLAVLRTHLKDAIRLRSILENDTAFDQHGLQSLTMSGKIRLVRERLGLPRPKKKAKDQSKS